jgi:hypothetical protein
MSNSTQDQEIDLSQLTKGISNFFQNIVNKCFDLLFFIKKKIIIIAVLFIAGIALGMFVDSSPSYTSKIIALPNFGSNDYLYDKVELLKSKLKEKDVAFFKSIGINNSEDFKTIEVKPINGIYNFINQKQLPQNFEFIKLMAEDGDLDKIIKDDLTSKNYYQHEIVINTSSKFTRESLVEPILKFLQSSEYFGKLQKIHQANLVEKINANKLLITQIDQLIIALSQSKATGGVTVSQNSGLTELVNKKDALVSENQALTVHQLEYDKIVKDQDVTINNINTKGLNDKMKLFLPFLFVLLFLIANVFSKVYKNQQKRVKA